LALSGVLLETSATARTLLHRRSSHVQTWAYVLESALDLDGDRAANVLGGRDCDPSRSDVSPLATELAGDGLDANCAGGPGRTRPRPRVASPGQGAAAGSDVILLSVDSLRHDVVDALSATRRALGPHATFDLAVSPSPMTRFSLSANLRGRAVRQIRFEDEPTDTLATLRHDRSPTIGHVLGDNGYRCVHVATTDHLDPPTRVAAGFHALDVTGFGAPPWRAGWPRRGKWFYRAPDAFSLLLRAARSTRGPLCAWTHLMDSHYPYYRGEVPASFDLAGLRASVRDLDGRIAAFLRAFAAIRRRPVVVAMFGDHGEAFDEHGTTHHASATYAEQVRVGALLAGPGVRPGRYAPPVTTTQLAPSVLELVGVRPPAPMTEPSLLAAMHGRGAWPEVAVSELHHAARHRVEVGYMTERWHLVRDAVHDVDELFDVRRDPREAHDVSRSEPAAAAAMRRLAARWDETH
ncbi:MAG: sulfatase-like hydrolase/transferase, partial [Deltaproteobacteria bacterium]|nr:sulfatase-like hydrolase/transferase [Deltaproteobacteria bacterium]